MNTHNIEDIDEIALREKAKLGDLVSLHNMKDLEVVQCEKTGVLMLNIDADQLAPGDLTFIKRLGLTISNPDTDKPIALGVDYVENSWGHKVKNFFESRDDDDDDSPFFGGLSGGLSGGLFGGGGFSSPSGGGFGGFGGGSFGGMGASRGF